MWTEDTLARLHLRKFKPPRLIEGPLRQTIVPYYIPMPPSPPLPGDYYQVEVSDGDQLMLRLCRPKSWHLGQRIVVLIHGLCGSEESPYIKRIGRKLFKLGFLVVKLNLRSCGPGRGLAKKPYHSGQSSDTRDVLTWLADKFPGSPITQVGFSLSANITLKMLGEEDEFPLKGIDSAVAVSPPLDLLATAYKVTELSNRVFDYFFLIKLRQSMKELYSDFPEMEKVRFPQDMNMVAFDDHYTAPRSGFDSAYDYYKKSSGKNFISKIKRPALILHSTDDPVVESNVLHQIKVPDIVDVLEFERGGHVGFFDHKGFWLDEAIIRWINSVDKQLKLS